MSREGEARRPALLEPPKRSPRSSFLPTMSRPGRVPGLSAVCRSAATASPPVRAAEAHSTACQGRAGGRAEGWGRAGLGLDRLCYTWAAARRQRRKKRVKGLDFGLYIIHVLAGPYALFGFRNTSGQLARRGRDIHFARYHMESKEERTAFVAALKYLLERVPLDVDLNALLSRWRWFAEGSVGCIGVLKDWLVDAVAATLVQKGTSLTEDILTRTMPHPARRLSLEMEARAGEHKVALHDSESAKQFQALVRKPAKAANGKAEPTSGAPSVGQATEIAESASATLPMPQVSPKPTQPRVGQRAPERDLVGEAAASSVRKAIGCSFTEEIPVTLAQIREAGVSRFECPTCLAVRDIPPKGGRIKFPWHPRRTTTIPNHGKRWVRRASIWEPAG